MMMKWLFLVLLLISISCSPQHDIASRYGVLIETLQPPTDESSEEPYLFTSRQGEVYLSWIEKKDTTSRLWYSRLEDNKWATPLLIAQGNNWFVNWADYPMMTKNKEHYIAHYLEKSGAGTYAYDVVTTQSKDGIQWTDGKVLNQDSLEAEHGFVSMIPYEDDFLLTWLDGRNTVTKADHKTHDHTASGAMTLRAAIVDIDGNKKQEWELDDRICDCCQTGATMTDNGPVIVYRDRSVEEIRDMYIVRLVNNRWTTPKIIHDDGWKIKGCPVNGPRVAALGNTVAIAWFTGANKTPKVNLSFSKDAGANFSAPVVVATESAIGRVDVVMQNENSAFVTWMEGADIKVMKVGIDGLKEEPIIISSSSESRSSGFPQMTYHNNNLIFAWTNDSLKQVLTARMSIAPDEVN